MSTVPSSRYIIMLHSITHIGMLAPTGRSDFLYSQKDAPRYCSRPEVWRSWEEPWRCFHRPIESLHSPLPSQHILKWSPLSLWLCQRAAPMFLLVTWVVMKMGMDSRVSVSWRPHLCLYFWLKHISSVKILGRISLSPSASTSVTVSSGNAASLQCDCSAESKVTSHSLSLFF